MFDSIKILIGTLIQNENRIVQTLNIRSHT